MATNDWITVVRGSHTMCVCVCRPIMTGEDHRSVFSSIRYNELRNEEAGLVNNGPFVSKQSDGSKCESNRNWVKKCSSSVWFTAVPRSAISSVDQRVFLLEDARQSRTTTITTTGYNWNKLPLLFRQVSVHPSISLSISMDVTLRTYPSVCHSFPLTSFL